MYSLWYIQKCSPERFNNGERGHVLILVKRPVVRSEGSSQHHLTHSYDPVHRPEEHEQHVELEHKYIDVLSHVIELKCIDVSSHHTELK